MIAFVKFLNDENGTNRFSALVNNQKRFYVLLFLIIYALITLRQNENTNYGCELCADKAGYYMYLPAFFHLGFNASDYPPNFDVERGNGFHLIKETNKVVTKFTCGIALLLSPFYALGALVAKVFSIPVSPYSYYYLFFVNIGAALYITFGLYFLRRWLSNYVNDNVALLTTGIVFFTTHLYYYTLDESIMAHHYSFSLFAAILFSLKTYTEKKEFKYFILLAVASSFAILVRPSNVIFILIALLADVSAYSDLKNKLKLLFAPKCIFFSVLTFAIVMLPQIMYWKFAFGKYIVWSYDDEGFIYWQTPHLLKVWFSPQGGLFPYTPIIFLSLFFAAVMFLKKEKNAMLIFISFFIVSYVCAAWWHPFFGFCNFGKRPFVDFLPILMLPIAYMLKYFTLYAKRTQQVLLGLVCFFFYTTNCYLKLLILASMAPLGIGTPLQTCFLKRLVKFAVST
jgi:hypothetical protein